MWPLMTFFETFSQTSRAFRTAAVSWNGSSAIPALGLEPPWHPTQYFWTSGATSCLKLSGAVAGKARAAAGALGETAVVWTGDGAAAISSPEAGKISRIRGRRDWRVLRRPNCMGARDDRRRDKREIRWSSF